MKRGDRITEMYAFVCLDPAEDVEGIPAIEGPFLDGKEVMMPLVAADKERLMSIMELAKRLVAQSGKSMRLVRFHQAETLEYFTPPSSETPTQSPPPSPASGAPAA
jgi:hypothetical protein